MESIRRSVVPVSDYNRAKDNSKKIEPNSVYRKKKYEARTFRARDPKIPIRKNIGIRTASKPI